MIIIDIVVLVCYVIDFQRLEDLMQGLLLYFDKVGNNDTTLLRLYWVLVIIIVAMMSNLMLKSIITSFLLECDAICVGSTYDFIVSARTRTGTVQ